MLNILLISHNQYKDLLLNLHYNWSNNFLFVNATKIYRFKAKASEIKDYVLIFQKNLRLILWKKKKKKKKTGFVKGIVKPFSVYFNLIDTSDILDIH